MSGIVGLYNLNSRPIDSHMFRKLLSKIAHRGPDGHAIWLNKTVGLGHCMLWTTPESLREKLPLQSRKSGCVITADVRIDNRDTLIKQLGLSGLPVSEITDSQIILSAYEKWGENSPQRLLGDFTFAIWDQQQQKLFCARDHMGCKPFYYVHLPGNFFAFASEIKALLGLPEVSRVLNDDKIAIYLCQLSGLPERSHRTFFKDVYRLLPAHSLSVTKKGVELKQYAEFDPEVYSHLKSEGDFVEAFHERFHEAVACRLRSAYPIVSTLSGAWIHQQSVASHVIF